MLPLHCTRISCPHPRALQLARIFMLGRVSYKALTATPGMALQVFSASGRGWMRVKHLLTRNLTLTHLLVSAQADVRVYVDWLTKREALLQATIAAAAGPGGAKAKPPSSPQQAAAATGAPPAVTDLEPAAAAAQLAHVQRALRECSAPDAALLGSNLHSQAEAVLLRWLSHHYNRINNGSASASGGDRRLIDFDADLADGTVFLSALLSHTPDLGAAGHALDPDAAATGGASFHMPNRRALPPRQRSASVASVAAEPQQQLSSPPAIGSVASLQPPSPSPTPSGPLGRRQCADNMRAVLSALKELQLDPPFDLSDLTSLGSSSGSASVANASSATVAGATATAAAPGPEVAVPPPPFALAMPVVTTAAAAAAAVAAPQPQTFISPAAAAELLRAGSPPPPACAPYDVVGSRPAVCSSTLPGTLPGAAAAPPPGATWTRAAGGALRYGGVLIALWLFNTLPQLVPRACVDFRGPLAQPTTRTLTLVNPSKKASPFSIAIGGDVAERGATPAALSLPLRSLPLTSQLAPLQAVTYTVTLEGSPVFSLPTRSCRVEPQVSLLARRAAPIVLLCVASPPSICSLLRSFRSSQRRASASQLTRRSCSAVAVKGRQPLPRSFMR
jgi:hypothetical protein